MAEGMIAASGGKVTVSGLVAGNIKSGATISVVRGGKLIASQPGSPDVMDVSSKNVWSTLMTYAASGKNPSVSIPRHFTASRAFATFVFTGRGSKAPGGGNWTVSSNGITVQSGTFSRPAYGDSDVFTVPVPVGGSNVDIKTTGNDSHELTASLFEIRA